MNIKYVPMDLGETRAICYAMLDELTDNGDGTYSFVDTAKAATFGVGSEIIVIDSPGKLLFVGDDGLAYDWTASSGGGASEEQSEEQEDA